MGDVNPQPRHRYQGRVTKPFTTASTVPDGVRPSLWRAWGLLWRRLRGLPESDRRLEFKSGTGLPIDGVEFSIRWDGWRFQLRLPGSDEIALRGSCAFGSRKPYVYAEELQEVVDQLLVTAVMRE